MNDDSIVSSPREFLEKVTLPNWWEYSENQSSIQRAFNTVISAFHLRDWTFNYYRGTYPDKIWNCAKIWQFQQSLERHLHSDFQILADIANSCKHMTLKQNREPGFPGATSFVYDGFRCGSSMLGMPLGGNITILKDNDTHGPFYPMVFHVMVGWSSFLRDTPNISRPKKSDQ